ncbi:MAG: hypothetical protein DRR19_14145 [Candidatus Parabeggiatoa sp. nov. 1]|nr:MAG: hypothetical protein DRR19_14145 [Gammaproteobacteria bacterium]
MVRRWQLWQPICIDQQPTVIPSIELLAMALIQKCSAAQTLAALTSFKPENCDGKHEPSQLSLPETVKICQLDIDTNIRGVHQRIMYSIPWLDNHQPPPFASFCA